MKYKVEMEDLPDRKIKRMYYFEATTEEEFSEGIREICDKWVKETGKLQFNVSILSA